MSPILRAALRSWRPPLLAVRSYAARNTNRVATGTKSHSEKGIVVPSTAQKVTIDPNHGLWHFFRKKEVEGEVVYETVETPGPLATGRSWTAAELRRKSFADLHTLWYVVLRERNLLATQREEARRMGVQAPHLRTSLPKMHQCRKTMARIKGILNERRLAYEGAVKLLHEQRAQAKTSADAETIPPPPEKARLHTMGRRRKRKPQPSPAASSSLFETVSSNSSQPAAT